MSFTSLATTYLVVFLLLSLGGLLRAHRLAEKLANLRRTLLLTTPGLVALVIGVLAEGQAPDLEAEGAAAALREAQNAQLIGFAAFVFTIAMLLGHAAIVLGELRAFVTTQSLDLATRQQVELADDRSR